MVEVKKLKIEGITCAMCVKSIEKRLQKLEGIESYSVNIIDNTALIKYNDKQIKIDDIITEIEKLGYKVIYYKEKSKKEIKKLYYSFLGIFLSLLMMISMNNHSLHHSLKYIYPIITILVLFLFKELFITSIENIKNKTVTMELMYFLVYQFL